MDNYNNAFLRLSYIISLLTSHDYDEYNAYTINQLHEITGIEHYLLIKDIITLIEFEVFSNSFRIDPSKGKNNLKEDDIDAFKKLLVTFQKSACDIPVYIDYDISPFVDEEDYDLESHIIYLKPIEKNALSMILGKKINDDLWIKKRPIKASENFEKIWDINNCIDKKKPISFDYKTLSGKKHFENYNAYKTFESFDNGRIYVIGINPRGALDFKRLDHMENIKTCYDSDDMPPCNEEALERLEYMWGADNDNTQKEPEEITLKIEENTKNIISKIKAETARRKYGKLELKKDKNSNKDYYIYTDKILGLNSFKRWLRKYGSSIVVLKPKELANDMYESAKKRLQNYEEINF